MQESNRFPGGHLLLGLFYILIFLDPLVNFYVSKSFQIWFLIPVLGVAYWAFFICRISISQQGIFALVFFFCVLFSVLTTSLLSQQVVFDKVLLFLLSILTFYLVTFLIGKNELFDNEKKYFYLIICVCAYGVYQWLAYNLGLPFVDQLVYRGRGLGEMRQITSFFAEPAFFGIFLTTAIYYLLFISENLNYKMLILVVFCVYLGRSLSCIMSVVILFNIYYMQRFLLRGTLLYKLIYSLLILFLALSSIVFYSEITETSTIIIRLVEEVFLKTSLLGQIPGSEKGSGAIRIFGELNYLIFTIQNSPYIGFGIDYNSTSIFQNFGIERKMSLNAIVELILRLGLIVFVLIICLFYSEKRKYPSKSSFAFIIYLIMFSFSDGAITKPEIYLPISIILGMERSKYHKKQDVRLLIR
jgi:hypothetical protein